MLFLCTLGETFWEFLLSMLPLKKAIECFPFPILFLVVPSTGSALSSGFAYVIYQVLYGAERHFQLLTVIFIEEPCAEVNCHFSRSLF